MVELLVLTIVVGFAGYRLARAITLDTITDPIRRLLYRWTYYEQDGPPPKGRLFVHDLMTCPLCVGWWVTLALGLFVSAQLTDAPIVQHVLLAVAATGVQCWLSMRESSG